MSSQPNALSSPPTTSQAERPSPWSPLKVELFRSLWIATSIAQIGTWTREAAGPTLMENLTASWPNRAEMVARVLVFSNLPIFLFSVFAGALADLLDRRKLLIVTQAWMVVVSAVLGLLTFTGHVTPGALLLLTFLLGVGTAAFGPALQAVLPELVPREQFALAINLNSIALNVARAVGPALFIVIVAVVPGQHGAGLAFILTAVTFVGAIWVLLRWERPEQRAAVAGEDIWNGIRAGFRYTIHSRANRAILLRVFAFIVPAVVIWSQVPIIATSQLHAAQTREEVQRVSALLFAFVGVGAIVGVLLMPRLHHRFKIDPVVNVCTLFFALGLILLSFVHQLWLAAFILVFLGVNWVIIPTNFNTATQKSVPLWVKGRAISFYLTVLFGSFAVGGAIWGRVTTAHGIGTSLLVGGIAMAAMLLLAFRYPLTLNEGHDLSPAHRPGTPPTGPDVPPPLDPVLGWTGPVDVEVEYRVAPYCATQFLTIIREVGRQRSRNGALAWKLSGGSSSAETSGHAVYIETFRFHSAAEYSRQPNRMTKEDAGLHQQARSYHAGEGTPMIRPRPAATGDGTCPMTWLGDQLVRAADRTIEEAERAVERLSR